MRPLLFSILLATLTVPLFAAPGPAPVPSLALTYDAEEQPTEKNVVTQALQGQLAAKGISIKIEPATIAIFNDRLARGDFEAMFNSWFIDYPESEAYLTDFYSKSAYRAARYNSPAFDQIYMAAIKAHSESEKLAHFHDAVKLLDHELAWVPLYSNNEIFLLKPGAAGFRSNIYQYYDYSHVALEHVRAECEVTPETFDPMFLYDLGAKSIATPSYEPLVMLDENAKIVPGLATEWTWSKDMDSVTFKLRPGVHFHPAGNFSHTPNRTMTAADVKFSFERLAKIGASYSYTFDHVRGIDEFRAGKAREVTGLQVVDDLTFRVVMKYPFPLMVTWLMAPAACIIPADTPEKYDFTHGSIGTGPFVLKSWDGRQALYTPQAGYWQKDEKGVALPYAKDLSIRIMLDANTTLLAYREGDLDILNVPIALFREVFDVDGSLKPEWKKDIYREVLLPNLKFIAFNMEKPPWGTNLELRQRISDSIDREAIVRGIFRGKARPARSVMPKGIPGFE